MLNDPTQITKSERRHWHHAIDAMRMIEHDLHDRFQRHPVVPPEWHQIWEEETGRAPKTSRVTIRLDDDVVKFFRALGPGYGPRINRVLRAFMHLRLSKMIDGPDTTDYILRPEELETHLKDRPVWRGD